MNNWQIIADQLAEGNRCILLGISGVKGSAPRDPGTSMVVTENGDQFGTIGGGALEWQATKQAQSLLCSHDSYMKQHRQQILGPDLEQCCGGVVDLSYELFTKKELPQVQVSARNFNNERSSQNLIVFGAGHVGKALIQSLGSSEFSIQWVDTRAETFPDELPENVTAIETDTPRQVLQNQPADTFVLIMTHCHKLDFQIACAALQHQNICFTGLIGSATKKARFVKRFAEAGLTLDQIACLTCPIGISGISSKTPYAIAASVTAQLLAKAELVKSAENSKKMRAFGENSRLTNVGGNR